MKCNNCGYIGRDTALFCAKCGTPMSKDQQCVDESLCEDNTQCQDNAPQENSLQCENSVQSINDAQSENAPKYVGEIAIPDKEQQSLWHRIPTIYLWLTILSFAFSLPYFSLPRVISLAFGILLYFFMRGNQQKKVIITLCISYICKAIIELYSSLLFHLSIYFWGDLDNNSISYIIAKLLEIDSERSTSMLRYATSIALTTLWPGILMLIVGVLAFKFHDKPWMKYKKFLVIIPALPWFFGLYSYISDFIYQYQHYPDTSTSEYLFRLMYLLSIFIGAASVAAITYYFIEYRKTNETSEKAASDRMIIDESIPKHIRSLRNDVIRAGKSPLFTVAIICYTAITLLSLGGDLGIISLLKNLSDIDGLDFLYYGAMILASAIEEFLGEIGISIPFFKFIVAIPSILTVIGLWMIYFSVRKGSYDLSLTSTGCKVIMAVQATICLAKSILWFAVIMLAGEAGDGSFFPETYESVAFFALIALVVTIVYGVVVCNALKSAIYSSISNEPAPVSGFLTFICVCDGILTILSSGFDITAIIEGVAVILFGLVLSKFRKISAAPPEQPTITI